MLLTTQCHQPLPVGASGSCARSAKLLVPAGGLLQESCGETLPPLQPKPLKTCAAAIVLPSARSVLESVNLPPPALGVSAAAVMVSAARSQPPAIQVFMGALLPGVTRAARAGAVCSGLAREANAPRGVGPLGNEAALRSRQRCGPVATVSG